MRTQRKIAFVQVKYPNLETIIKDVIQYSYDDYNSGNGPVVPPDENIIWNVSYIIACFVAQQYGVGVETEEPLNGLKLKEPMTYAEREILVREFLHEFP